MNTATAIPNMILPLNENIFEGKVWFQLDYDGSYEDYKSKPLCILYKGLYFKRMSHNSDTFKVSYRQTPKSEFGEIIK